MGHDSQLEELRKEFYLEATTLLDASLDLLSELSQSQSFQQDLLTLYGMVHTFKGNSAAVKLYDLSYMAHEMEDIIEALKKSGQPDKSLISLLLKSVRTMSMRVIDLKTGHNANKEAADAIMDIANQSLQSSNPLHPVSFRTFFKKCDKMVQSTAEELNKEVHFEGVGEELEIPRLLMDCLTGPVFHLLRNAIDHGIEDKGRVTLKVFFAQNNLILKVKDNGKGINRKNVLKKAHQRGLLGPTDKEADLTDSEIYRLILEPGFSTADKVSIISGRGIGLNVVKDEVDALGGMIEIKSSTQGTSFMLTIPLDQKANPDKDGAA